MSKPKTQVDLLLDSGAYTAWKKKKPIHLEAYVDFIQANKHLLTGYVNLDMIPGDFGRIPSHDEVEASAKLGWKNLTIMRKEGLEPVHVFHQGERMYWLEKLVDSGAEYIGISPANDRTTSQKQAWLDEVFGYLCTDKGYPCVKTHGFGVTALPLLFRYPWYSADSVTWLLVGAYGGILVPKMRSDGEWDFTVSPEVVSISAKSSDAAYESMKHFAVLGKKTQQYVRDYLEKIAGVTDLKDLEEDYISRQIINCKFFKAVAKHYEVQPFTQSTPSFFGGGQASKKTTGLSDHHLRLVFTLTTSPEHSEILQNEKIRERLMSYIYFQDGSAKFGIEEYVMTGLLPPTKKSKNKKEKAVA